MSKPGFDSIAWYSTWSTRELQVARNACLREAEVQSAWGGHLVTRNRYLCFSSARRYAAEIVRRGGR